MNPDLTDLGFLGRGSAKLVRKVQWKGRVVAAYFGCEGDEIKLLKAFPDQARLLQSVGQVTPGRVVLVDVAPHGSLRDLHDALDFGDHGFLDAHRHEVLDQVLSALQLLWDARWQHNDVASRNVLVFAFAADQPWRTHVRLADFGDAKKSTTFDNDVRGLGEVADELYEMVLAHKPPPQEGLADDAHANVQIHPVSD